MLVFCFLWLGWLIFGKHDGSSSFTLFGSATPTVNSSAVQIPFLQAEGITLGRPTQAPTLNQQQALALANLLEPSAATQAKSATASYVSLSYPNTSTPATHATLTNVSAWMVLYQQIPYQPADANVDPTPFPHSSHDLYVFIDAGTGKELLAVWA